jgi:hypothetical protein
MLRRHVINTTVGKADLIGRSSGADTTLRIYPPDLNQIDDPSLWPDSLRILATELEKAVLLSWKNDAAKKQMKFAVLYTPKTVSRPSTEQNCWKPMLEKFCLENNIPFIDPTNELSIIQQSGNDVYFDHYTKYGHMAVTRKFVSWYLNNIEQ